MSLIDFLQSKGVKLNRPDAHNAFALHYAAQMAGSRRGDETDPRVGKKVLDKLLTKDVDVDCRDKDKRTPLIWASSSGQGRVLFIDIIYKPEYFKFIMFCIFLQEVSERWRSC